MKILDLRPLPLGMDGDAIAYFDIALTDNLRLYNVRFVRNKEGNFRSFAPTAFGKRCATFTPELANEITAAATAAWKGRVANVAD